jgi:hypothetical protein
MKKFYVLFMALLFAGLLRSQCTNSICITIPDSSPDLDLCGGGTLLFLIDNQSGASLTDLDVSVTVHPDIVITGASALEGVNPIPIGTPQYNGSSWLIPLSDTYLLQNGKTISVTLNLEVDCSILNDFIGQYPIATPINFELLNNLGQSIAQLSGGVNSVLIHYSALALNMSTYTFTGPFPTPPAPAGYHYVWRSVVVNNPAVPFEFSAPGDPLRGFRINTHYIQDTRLAAIYDADGFVVNVDIAPSSPDEDISILFDGDDYQQISGFVSNTWEADTNSNDITYWELLEVANCNSIYQSQSTVGWSCPGVTLTHTSDLCYTSIPPVTGNIPPHGGNPNLQRSTIDIGTPDYCYGDGNLNTYSFSYTNIGTVQATNVVLNFEDNQTSPFNVSFTDYSNFSITPYNAANQITQIDEDHFTLTIASIDPGQVVTISWNVQHDCPATSCTQDVYMNDWRFNLSYGGRCDGTLTSHGLTYITTAQRGGGLVPIGPDINALSGNNANNYPNPLATAEFGLSLMNASEASEFTWPGNGANQGILLEFSIGQDMNVFDYQNQQSPNHLLSSVRLYIASDLIPATCYSISYQAGLPSNTAPDVILIEMVINQNGLGAFLTSIGRTQNMAGLLDDLFLLVDLEPRCPAFNSNFCDLEVYHIPDALCSETCLIPLYCSTNNPIVVNCPGCNNHGVFVDDFKFWRTTYGLPDANNDGIADNLTPLTVPSDDPSELPMGVAERRVMYQDQFITSVRGHIELNPAGYYPTSIGSPPFDFDGTNYGWERWTLRLQFGPDAATGSGCWDDVEFVPNGITVWIGTVQAVFDYDPVIAGDYYDPNSHEFCIHLDCARLQQANVSMPGMLIHGMTYRVDCEFRLNNNIGFGVPDIQCPIIANCYAALRDENFADPTTWLVHLDECDVTQTTFLDSLCSGNAFPPTPSCEDAYPTVPNNNLIVDDCNDIRWICINGTNNTSFDEVGFDMQMFDFMAPANDEATRAGICQWQFRGHPWSNNLPRRRMRMANEDIPYGLIFPYEFRNWAQLEQISYDITPPLPAAAQAVFSLESLNSEENLYYDNNNTNNLFDTTIAGEVYRFYNYLTDFERPDPVYPVLPGVPHGNPVIDFNGWYTNGFAPSLDDPINLPDDSHITRGLPTMRFECPPPPADYTITLTEVDQFENGVGDRAFENGSMFGGNPALWQDEITLAFQTNNNQPVLEITDNLGTALQGQLCFENIVIENESGYATGSEAPHVWFGIDPLSNYQGWGDMTFDVVASGKSSYPTVTGFTIPSTTLTNGDFVFFLNQYFGRNFIARTETFTIDVCIDYDCANPPNPLADSLAFNFGWSCNPLDSGLWQFTNPNATTNLLLRQSFRDLILEVDNAIENSCSVLTEPLSYGIFDPQITLIEQEVTSGIDELCSELEYEYFISNPAFGCLEEILLTIDIPATYIFNGLVEFSYMGSPWAPVANVTPTGNGGWIADISSELPSDCLRGFQVVPYIANADVVRVRFKVSACCDVDYNDKQITVLAQGTICEPDGIAFSPANALPYVYDPYVNGSSAPLNEIHIGSGSEVIDNGCGQYTLNVQLLDGTAGDGNPTTNDLNDVHVVLPTGSQFVSVNLPYDTVSTNPLIILIPEGMTLLDVESTPMVVQFELSGDVLCGENSVVVQPYATGAINCALPSCNVQNCSLDTPQQDATNILFEVNPPSVQLTQAGTGCDGYLFTVTDGCGNYSWTINGTPSGTGNSLQVAPSSIPQEVCVKDLLVAGGQCSTEECFTTDTCGVDCTADFMITQIDGCCYLFEDMTPGVFPCQDGGWGIFNNTDTSWVATYQGVSSFQHCFEANGEYLICNTVCCGDGTQDKICHVLQVTGCSCSADFIITQTSSCCYHFEDLTPEILPCPAGGWGIFRADGSWVATYLNTSSVDHCFEEPGEYLICNTICCGDESLDKVCHTVYVEGCACTADFVVDQIDNCCFKFTDLSPDVFPCDVGGWGIFTSTGEWVATYQNVSGFEHCFEADGAYLVCNTVCCDDGSLQKACKEIIVTGCNCKPKIIAEQINECCYRFTDPSYSIECDMNKWEIFDVDGNFVESYGAGNEIVHCFSNDGTYKICRIVCCFDGTIKEECITVDVKDCKCEPQFTYTIDDKCCYHFVGAYPISDGCTDGGWFVYNGFGELIFTSYAPSTMEYCFETPGIYTICFQVCCKDKLEKQCITIEHFPDCCEREVVFESVQLEDPCCYKFTAPNKGASECRTWTLSDSGGNIVYSGNEESMEWCIPEGKTFTLCLTECCLNDKGEHVEVNYCQEVSCGSLKQVSEMSDALPMLTLTSPNEKVIITPNPNAGRFVLRTTDDALMYSMVLISATGARLWSQELMNPAPTSEITVQNLESGLYYLLVKTDSGMHRVRCLIVH